jgi:hypothetical protein
MKIIRSSRRKFRSFLQRKSQSRLAPVATVMGIVVGNILFALFFYLVVTPLGLLLRLRRNPPITKGFDKTRKSYWRDAKKPADLKRYYRQF